MVKNIYDKVSSKDSANKRLKVILIHDRACLDDNFLETIKCEIMNIIARYVRINNLQVEVKLITSDIEEDKSPVLVSNLEEFNRDYSQYIKAMTCSSVIL